MSGIFAKHRISIFLIMILMTGVPLLAEDADELYRKGKFADAEHAYRQGDMDHPRDLRYRYNRGCAAFQKQDYEAAAAAFSSTARRAKDSDPELAFRSLYNLGNIAYQQNDFASASEYFKMALKYKPESPDAKYNLELALKKLKEAAENPDKDKQCDKNKKNENQKQDKKGQSDKGQSKQDKNGEKQKNENKEAESGSQEKKQDLSGELSAAGEMPEDKTGENKEENAAALLDKKKAEALLDNIKEDRARILQYQMQKEKRNNNKSGKTW